MRNNFLYLRGFNEFNIICTAANIKRIWYRGQRKKEEERQIFSIKRHKSRRETYCGGFEMARSIIVGQPILHGVSRVVFHEKKR